MQTPTNTEKDKLKEIAQQLHGKLKADYPYQLKSCRLAPKTGLTDGVYIDVAKFHRKTLELWYDTFAPAHYIKNRKLYLGISIPFAKRNEAMELCKEIKGIAIGEDQCSKPIGRKYYSIRKHALPKIFRNRLVFEQYDG